MKQEILNLLRTREDYVSSKELCQKFGVSRTAIWKAINQLKEAGYQIESVTNRGYFLKESPDLITAEEIRSYCRAEEMGKEIVYFEETDSTNTQAALSAERYPSGTLFVAEMQTAGKGRRGRSWNSPQSTNIAMSLLLKPQIDPNHASMLTLVSALALGRAVERVIEENAGADRASDLFTSDLSISDVSEDISGIRIKWPNDIVLDGKKIVGILTEMSAQVDYINYVVIGLGVNVGNREFEEEYRDRAGSIESVTGLKVKRAQIIGYFLEEFEKRYRVFLETEDLSGLMEEYNGRTVNLNRPVRVLDPKEPFTGIARGIAKTGELLVEKDGKTIPVSSGEVSVRGIYGYV